MWDFSCCFCSWLHDFWAKKKRYKNYKMCFSWENNGIENEEQHIKSFTILSKDKKKRKQFRCWLVHISAKCSSAYCFPTLRQFQRLLRVRQFLSVTVRPQILPKTFLGKKPWTRRLGCVKNGQTSRFLPPDSTWHHEWYTHVPIKTEQRILDLYLLRDTHIDQLSWFKCSWWSN